MNESAEQKEIVKWFRETWPEHSKALRVSQFGNDRGAVRGKRAAIRTAKAKGQGAVVGESDIAIVLPRGKFGALLIEHKAGEGTHKVTEAQQAYIDYHNANGNCACSTKGIEAAKAAIRIYMESV